MGGAAPAPAPASATAAGRCGGGTRHRVGEGQVMGMGNGAGWGRGDIDDDSVHRLNPVTCEETGTIGDCLVCHSPPPAARVDEDARHRGGMITLRAGRGGGG